MVALLKNPFNNVWKVSVFEFFLSAFSHIWTNYSVQMRENTDHKNSKYGHFSRSATQWLALVLRMVCSPYMGKRKILCLYQFFCCLFVEKSLSDYYIMKSMNFLVKVTRYPWHIQAIWWKLWDKGVFFYVSKVFDKVLHN